MKFKKGQKVTVTCNRKGTYNAVVTALFDTEKDEWYNVAVDQTEPVRGITQEWYKGESIPCRRGHATVKPRGKR